jgi:hypothetical protein
MKLHAYLPHLKAMGKDVVDHGVLKALDIHLEQVDVWPTIFLHQGRNTTANKKRLAAAHPSFPRTLVGPVWWIKAECSILTGQPDGSEINSRMLPG